VGPAQETEAKVSKPIVIFEEFKEKGNKAADDVAKTVIENRSLLNQVFEGVMSTNKRVKNAAAKTLKIVSEIDPSMLYPRLSFFVKMIDGDDTILQWICMDIVGNLSFVDKENRINRKVLNRYLSLLSDETLVTAAHSVDNLWKIAINKPRYQKDITAKLLEAESVERKPDCRGILAGKVILAFTEYFNLMKKKDRAALISFAERQLKSTWKPTRKKAETFLKKFVTA
jgi:hypothetical protein